MVVRELLVGSRAQAAATEAAAGVHVQQTWQLHPLPAGDLLAVEICNLGPLPGDEWVCRCAA